MTKILLPTIIVLVAVSAFIFFANSNKSSVPTLVSTPAPTLTTNFVASSSAQSTKLFKSSKTMKFSIEVPSDYIVEEKFAAVTITTPLGEKIYIDKNATNLNNISDFIKDLEIKNKSDLSDKRNITINNLSAISAEDNKEKDYFIYTEYNVYLLYTKIKIYMTI